MLIPDSEPEETPSKWIFSPLTSTLCTVPHCSLAKPERTCLQPSISSFHKYHHSVNLGLSGPPCSVTSMQSGYRGPFSTLPMLTVRSSLLGGAEGPSEIRMCLFAVLVNEWWLWAKRFKRKVA